MRSILMVSAMILSLSAFAGTQEKFKLISAGDLAKELSQKDAKLAVFDVNNEQTRKQDGTIPGAKLLPSSKYDVAKELPAAKDSKLVFYCANTQCMASHAAADIAVKAGYTDVAVMKDGIQGWKKSGHPVERIRGVDVNADPS